jgi:hypothetical protein
MRLAQLDPDPTIGYQRKPNQGEKRLCQSLVAGRAVRRRRRRVKRQTRRGSHLCRSAILPRRHSETYFGLKRDIDATRVHLASRLVEARSHTANVPSSLLQHKTLVDDRLGSFTTDPASVACRSMSASPRKRTFNEHQINAAALAAACGQARAIPLRRLCAPRPKEPSAADKGCS